MFVFSFESFIAQDRTYGVKYSKLFRYLAIVLDDFFYGKKPSPKPLPGWLNAAYYEHGFTDY
jgi:hypothetical protein